MVRCMLHTAGLGPEYWSFALSHAVYIKNRLPHSATGQTPYYSFTGKRPDASHLRIWGCRVFVRLPGKRSAKLDLNSTTGTFLGYTATDKNIIYIDEHTHKVKTATHCTFDEAMMTVPRAQLSPAIIALQDAGYRGDLDNKVTSEPSSPTVTTAPMTLPTPPCSDAFYVKPLSIHATIPTRATDGSVGYDLYSATDVIIPPLQRAKVPTDLALCPPQGTYGQIHSRSGLAATHCLDVTAGTIDPDYRGNIVVLLHNHSLQPYTVCIGDRIAQLIFHHVATPTPITVD
jgi:dUTP pyrophosphatase